MTAEHPNRSRKMYDPLGGERQGDDNPASFAMAVA
jgi:hypothetical protein